MPTDTPSERPVREALLSGNIARARALIDSLEPPPRILWGGILAITQNDATDAIRILRKGDHPKALGVAYYLAHQYLLFRDQMAAAIRQYPADFGPYYYLGRHYDSDVDNLEEAIRWFRLALERKPDFASARSHLGNCLERLGRTEEAEAAYQASSTMPLSMVGLARLRLAAGDAEAALALAEKANTLEPRNLQTAKLRAKIYGQLHRSQDVVRALESAAAIDPRDPSIQYQLSQAYRLIRESTKAAAAFAEFERLRTTYGLTQ